MRLYRICHVRYLEDLRGLGASYRDEARWNEPGFPIVYFAETPSVAMLEMAHYLPSPCLVPPGYRLGVYEVGDEVALERWHVRDLPEGWDRYPHPQSTRRMGTSWLMRKEAPLLAVPSAAVPGGLESIVLANPNVLDEGAIRLIASEERIYNPRAFASEQGGQAAPSIVRHPAVIRSLASAGAGVPFTGTP